jgi:hypothetical protein
MGVEVEVGVGGKVDPFAVAVVFEVTLTGVSPAFSVSNNDEVTGGGGAIAE